MSSNILLIVLMCQEWNGAAHMGELYPQGKGESRQDFLISLGTTLTTICITLP